MEFYTGRYSRMRRGIVPHPVNVTAENVDELLDANFVFLAMDTGPDKRVIIETLTAGGISFIDTGVGLSKDADGLVGLLRVTTSTAGRSDHIERDGLISYFVGEDAAYDTNIQVDELNALAANLAIIRYKKLLGFYPDVEGERHTVFVLNSGDLHHRYGTSDNVHVDHDPDAESGELDGLLAHVRHIEAAHAAEATDDEPDAHIA